MVQNFPAVTGSIYRVQGPQTIADVERELVEIEAQRPVGLQVPVRPGKWWFGGEAALVQLLITWGKQQTNTTLVTYIGEDEDPSTQLERMVTRPFGLAAAWMAQDVTDRVCGKSLKVQANSISTSEIDLMWFGRRKQSGTHQPSLWSSTEEDVERPELASVGNRVFLASIDHHSRWRIPPCYFPTGEVRHREDFMSLADSMAQKATSATGGSPVTSDVRRPLGAILHELFKNTHEWARSDEHGVPLLRSVRGLLAQGHTWAENEAMEVAGGSPALADYLYAPDVREPEGRWRFLELSVFDSGPGLARRRLAEFPEDAANPANPTLEEEYWACVECFKRWSSSTRAGHKGLGLHEVMQVLSSLGSFFRIRTGRLSFYRDFIALPFVDPKLDGNVMFFDWTTRSDVLTQLASVEGTLYTILIPIRRRRI